MILKINDETGVLEINDARICYRNFSGAASEYNREGDRNFSLVIPDAEIADILTKESWNVKTKEPRNVDEEPFYTLPVTVRFNDYGPNVYLISGNKRQKLDVHSVHRLDRISIAAVDMDIRPYDWTANNKSGRKAYLSSMKVIQNIDRFAAEFEDLDDAIPFDK